jgi:uncharacterized membrane protein YeaQ/YmgE (transglycosylase-associated protein family)
VFRTRHLSLPHNTHFSTQEGGKAMNIVMWVMAGGALGWIGYSHFGYNEDRGMKTSVLIGSAGGFIGGKLIAPLFLTAAAASADFSVAALFVAAVVAGAFLFASSAVHDRWGV